MAVGHNNFKLRAEKKMRSSAKSTDSGFTVCMSSGNRIDAKTLNEAVSVIGDNRGRIIRNKDSVVVWKR